jgi:Ca2+-binding EF-hand superfamily protein
MPLDILECIAANTHIIMKNYKTKGPRLRFHDFVDMFDLMGLSDPDLARRLFELFENRNEGIVDLREMIMGMDVLREKRIDDRADTFFHLADVQEKGTVNEEELYNILKTNMDTRDEKLALKLLSRF